MTFDDPKVFTNGIEDGQLLLMHTPSGMGRFGDFCDFIANICTARIGLSYTAKRRCELQYLIHAITKRGVVWL